MKCGKCGSEHGFRGEQAVDPKTSEPIGQERVYCKTCGAEVEKEHATVDRVLPTVPKHLAEEHDTKKLKHR